jgi:hypothetical protein
MIHSKLTLITKTFAKLFFENNAIIINSELLQLKLWTNQITGLLRNSKIHIESHSKEFIRTINHKVKCD